MYMSAPCMGCGTFFNSPVPWSNSIPHKQLFFWGRYNKNMKSPVMQMVVYCFYIATCVPKNAAPYAAIGAWVS